MQSSVQANKRISDRLWSATEDDDDEDGDDDEDEDIRGNRLATRRGKQTNIWKCTLR